MQGPLRVLASNPRYFTDDSGKAIYLTGSHEGWELQDDAWGGFAAPGTEVTFDFERYLDFLATHNLNLIRLWCVETTRWDAGPPEMIATPMPFARTGSQNALDGRPKFDLTQFDKTYFKRLRSRVEAANVRGIYVMIVLFEGFSCVHPVSSNYVNPGANPWFGHPFNIQNNINGIDGDVNGDGWGLEVHSLSSPPVNAVQKAYVRKIIDTVNEFDNVLYEIANESIPESTDWQYDMINTIKDYELSKPKQHPVVMSAFWPGPTNPTLMASPADAIAPAKTGTEDYEYDPPIATGSKVIIADSDHINWTTKDPLYVWKNFMRGNNAVIFDVNLLAFDWSRGVVVEDDGSSEPIRQAMGDTRMYADRCNLAAMTPRTELSSTAYCLANPGSEYLVYQPDSGTFSVDLEPGVFAYEWFNPSTHALAESGSRSAGGGTEYFTPPFGGQAVLYLRAQGQ